MAGGAAVIFIEFGVLVTLIVTLISCVCCRKKRKSTYPDPENKPQDSLNNNQNLLVTNVENGDHRTSDEGGLADGIQLRNRGTIPPRELPELPQGEVVLNHHDSNSDINYARVSDISHTSRTAIASLTRSNSIDVNMHVQSSQSDDSSNVVPNDFNAYATVKPSPSRHSQNFNEIPPPVPEKHFEQGEASSFATGNLSAASAVAGIADIPYMTSPQRTAQDLNRQDAEFIYDGNLQTPCYTSISVREPLENIRCQMPRQQYIEESEPTYSSVPDDSDQVYAEIQPNKHPPAPPTVESLKNVAQAQHSRQASCSSFTACDATSPHSPTSERSVNPNSWGAQATIEEPNSLYSVINKPKKQTPLEDIYARVQKDSSKSTGAWSKQSANGHEPSHHGARKEINDSKSAKGNSLVRRSSSKDDPNYEKIQDSPLRTTVPGTKEPHDLEQLNVIRPIGSLNSRDEENGSDPPYETMPGSKRFGDYETIQDGYTCNSDEENEAGYEMPMPYQRTYPNYESVDDYAVTNGTGKATPGENMYCQIPPREETNDPLYEKIGRLDDDPNYEKVKTVSEQSDEESTEAGYEPVKHSALLQNPYEKVRECDELLNVDPGYEKIHDNRVELHVEWNGNALTPIDRDALPLGDDGSDDDFVHIHQGPLASSSSEILPDFVLPPTASGDSRESPYSPLNPVNGIAIYNMAYSNDNDQACGLAVPNEREDNNGRSPVLFSNERHDSLL